MKLTKTEQEILTEARRGRFGLVGIDHGHQGPSGRKRAFGVRRIRAAHSLAKKGLLELVPGTQSTTNLYSTTGWGVNGAVWSSMWKLTNFVVDNPAPSVSE